MIIYKKSGKTILEMLKESGYNTGRIRKENILSQSVVQRLRNNEMIDIKNLGKICDLLRVQPNDLVKNVTENEEM